MHHFWDSCTRAMGQDGWDCGCVSVYLSGQKEDGRSCQSLLLSAGDAGTLATLIFIIAAGVVGLASLVVCAASVLRLRSEVAHLDFLHVARRRAADVHGVGTARQNLLQKLKAKRKVSY